jgi:hypothetical protein
VFGIVRVGEVAGWGVEREEAEVVSGWEMVEGEDSIGIEGIGHILAGKGAGQIIVMMTGTESIVVDCNIVEGCIAAVWIQG